MFKKFLSFVLLAAILVLAFPLFSFAEMERAKAAVVAEVDSMIAQDREGNTILVFMEEGVTKEEAEQLFISCNILKSLDDREICLYRSYDVIDDNNLLFVLHVPESRIRQILIDLSLSDIVKNASVNLILHIDDWAIDDNANDSPSHDVTSAQDSPYDPLTTQWAFEQIKHSGAYNPSKEILVGVMDSGYNPHEDVDCVDMELARNFYEETGDGNTVKDNVGHGTFIVGQIGAALNGVGVNGVCTNAKIVPLKVGFLDTNGKGSTNLTATCKAMKYAESIGIKILNFSTLLNRDFAKSMIDTHFTGILVIAAGNYGEDVGLPSEEDVVYGYDLAPSNWIVVGSTQQDGSKRSNSNYSKNYVDLFAPGDYVYGISADGKSYTRQRGTSMAAPFVTGAAAIILGMNPFLTSTQVCEKLTDTATPCDSLKNYCVSGGILNISAATTSLRTDYRGAYSLGDIDGDGYITETDYLLLKRAVLGTYLLNSQQSIAADVNNDQTVDTADYLLVKRFILGTLYFPPHHI